MFVPVMDTTLPEFVPRFCPVCGAPTSVNDNLTRVACTDRKCSGRVAARFNDFCDHFQVKGIGVAGLTRCIEQYEIYNPYQMVQIAKWGHELYTDIPVRIGKRVNKALVEVAGRGLGLPEIVETMYLPDIGASAAQSLFGDMRYDGWLGELGALVDSPFKVQEKLGIQGTGLGARAEKINMTLGDYHDDIVESVDILGGFAEPVEGAVILHGAYTSKVATSLARTKRDFYQLVEDSYSGYHVIWENSVNKNSDFLITGSGSVTGKMRSAEKWGVPVFNEDEFLAWLDKGAGE